MRPSGDIHLRILHFAAFALFITDIEKNMGIVAGGKK